ncbi:MAG: O-antigen ligase family protein [Chloroflexota bacterium]|nr:MAG: O-antigen ligase family protein [Chloroflexota bacterium]
MESKRSNPQTVNKSVYQLERFIAAGLAIFLLLLPFHLVIKRLVPDPLGTYWKEILLGILVILWLIRCLFARRILLSGTPIDWAVLAYLGFLVLRLILDRTGWVAAWGFYVSVLYLPIFWLVPTALHLHSAGLQTENADAESKYIRPDYATWINRLIMVLVLAGTLIAIGGIIEFLLDRPLWPSDELLQRQGFSDVYIYNTQIRRVYFTLDSPTALANTLAMLLPLALVLIFTLKKTWARLLAGFAAASMAACIVLTFSRGIWVAVVLALVVMGIISGFLRRNWKSVLIILGSIAVIGLVWVVVVLARTEDQKPSYPVPVELSASEYLSLPLTSISTQLLLTEPESGQLNKQTWALTDPVNGSEDIRDVLFEHPPESGKGEVVFKVDVPEAGALRFGIAMAPDVWTPEMGDGASFKVYIEDSQTSEAGQYLFVRYINPKLNPSDRRWRNYLVDLSPWAGQSIYLSLITEPGPNGNWDFDWAGWSDLQVVTLDPNYPIQDQKDNPVVRHTNSVLDWVRDETNRDRLAAWSLSLEAWREATFWGKGLGSTGVAALRTKPETAFVTESQVLKGLVELGIPGFLLLAFLWFQIAVTGFFAYTRARDRQIQAMLLGVAISLLIVFIEGLVYQNLEVKQVNAYFWTIVGILAVLNRATE